MLERIRIYYQNPEDIIKELTIASNILSVRQNNNNSSNLKGASLNNNTNPFKALDNIRRMFGLVGSNNITSNNDKLKGASVSNNNNLCPKTKSFIKLKKHFGLI